MVRYLVIPVLVATMSAAEETAAQAVSVRLMTDVTTVAAGQAFRAGVLFTIARDWHLYWRNPGDAGLPPHFTWHVPDRWSVRECPWPAPQRYAEGPLTSYGYGAEVLLSVVITPPRTLAAADSAELRAEVSWLACKEACIPGRAVLSRSLRLAADSARDADAAAVFDRAEAQWPRASADWRIVACRRDGNIAVSVWPEAEAVPRFANALWLFPAEPGLVASQPLLTGVGATLETRFDIATTTEEHRALRRLAGVLVLSPSSPEQPVGGSSAVLIEVPISDGPSMPRVEIPSAKENVP